MNAHAAHLRRGRSAATHGSATRVTRQLTRAAVMLCTTQR